MYTFTLDFHKYNKAHHIVVYCSICGICICIYYVSGSNFREKNNNILLKFNNLLIACGYNIHIRMPTCQILQYSTSRILRCQIEKKTLFRCILLVISTTMLFHGKYCVQIIFSKALQNKPSTMIMYSFKIYN